MSIYNSLILKRFNPCADRVEALESHLKGEQDQVAEVELIDHMETCGKCRKYVGYLEAVEKGFSGFEASHTEISPIAAGGLPLAIRDEMIESLRRNLGRWLFELARSVMYRQGMVPQLFDDGCELFDFHSSHSISNNIFDSLFNLNCLPKEEESSALHCKNKIANIDTSGIDYNVETLGLIFENSLSFFNDSMKPYIFYTQLFYNNEKYKEAIERLRSALHREPSSIGRAALLTNLGSVFHKFSDTEEALCLYKEANSLNELSSAHLNIALIHLSRNSTKEAMHHFKRAVELIDNINDPIRRSNRNRSFSRFLEVNREFYLDQITNNQKLACLFNVRSDYHE